MSPKGEYNISVCLGTACYVKGSGKLLDKLQEELAQTPVEATAGGGVVKVVVNGANEVLSVEINPEVLDPDDPEMVQDLVMAAVNEALRKAQEMVNTEMGKLTAGMKLPGGMGGMF